MAGEILIADRTLILNNGKIVSEIKKEELIEKANVLKQYDIKEPLLLEVLTKLKGNGISLSLKDFTVDELVEELKRRLKNEGCN